MSIAQIAFNKLTLIIDAVVSNTIKLSNIYRLCRLRNLKNAFIGTSLN